MFESLHKLIDSHEACDNPFFNLGRAWPWRVGQLRTFCPDYYAWIKSFPSILSGLIANTCDLDFQFFLTQILFSELGSGDVERMHFKLFERILRKLGLSDEEINAGARFRETHDLIEGMCQLYRHEDILRAMGAQYALERQAFPMIDKLYVGFKHYENLTRDDFEYFELHLVEEPEHLACMEECMQRCVGAPEEPARVEAGAKECLELIAAFWRRMYRELTDVEDNESCYSKQPGRAEGRDATYSAE